MSKSTMQTLLGQLEGNSGATLQELQAFEQETRLKIPPEYRQILLKHDGGEAQIGNTELMLWSASYLLQAHSEFEVESALPGALLFASDENADAYGFDLRAGASGDVVKVPMIGMGWNDAVVVGTSFEEFLERLSRG